MVVAEEAVGPAHSIPSILMEIDPVLR